VARRPAFRQAGRRGGCEQILKAGRGAGGRRGLARGCAGRCGGHHRFRRLSGTIALAFARLGLARILAIGGQHMAIARRAQSFGDPFYPGCHANDYKKPFTN
jgi:hypothetical protein